MKKTKTIGQLVSVYPPYRGGMGHVAFEYARLLKTAGYGVKSYTLQKDEMSKGDVIRIRPWIWYGNAGFNPLVYASIFKNDIILLHYPYFGMQEILALLLFFSKKKFILLYHMDFWPSSFIQRVIDFLSIPFRAFLLKRADAILVSTKDFAYHSQIKKHVMKYSDKVHAIPFGVNESFVSADPMPYAMRENRILFVGGLDKAHSFKGLDILLQAIVNVQDASLDIVGDGDMRGEFEKRATELGIQDRVEFHGNVDDVHMAQHFSQSRIFVLPSTTSQEAFGLVLLEAFANKTPVIASNFPGVREIASQGGVVVESGDVQALSNAIGDLLQNKTKAQSLGESGYRAVSEKYKWSKVGKELEQVIESL